MCTERCRTLSFVLLEIYLNWAYALIVTSNNMAAIGIMNNPSQNTGEVNNNLSIPANTAAIGTAGQKLLKLLNIL